MTTYHNDTTHSYTYTHYNADKTHNIIHVLITLVLYEDDVQLELKLTQIVQSYDFHRCK